MTKQPSTTLAQALRNALKAGLVVPAFNVPYLPMIEPVVQAIVGQDVFALIETSRLEWLKFESHSPDAVMEAFQKFAQPEYVRLHLDHVPVIDEDNQHVDYVPIFKEALALGYDSVMVDGSRLNLEDNIAATRTVVDMAHAADVPCEAELGAVLGHEAGPLPPYDVLFNSGQGFTDAEEAARFVQETACDWLSVAFGNVHGAISGVRKDKKKVAARLNLEHLDKLRQVTDIPLVLHGGSSIKRDYLLEAIKRGIAKVNIATEIRQAYEQALKASEGSIKAAQDAVYERTCWLLRDYLAIAGTRRQIIGS